MRRIAAVFVPALAFVLPLAVFVVAVTLCAAGAPAQAIDWKAVDHRRELNMKSWPRFYDVTRAEQAQMRTLVAARTGGTCGRGDSRMQVTPQPLAPGRRDFMVSCDRDDRESDQASGQATGDASGAQWIVEFTGGRGRVLGELDGFLSHLEPSVSHGLHDVVMSRHVGGACCYALSYYRFDGRQYHLIGAADVVLDAGGNAAVTPKETPAVAPKDTPAGTPKGMSLPH